MNVPRNIALPIVLTMCALTGITALFSFLISTSEVDKLRHVSQMNKDDLPSVTEFYSHIYGLAFVLPALSWPVGFVLLRQPHCELAPLTRFVCLCVLATVLWSLYSHIAVYVGNLRFNELL